MPFPSLFPLASDSSTVLAFHHPSLCPRLRPLSRLESEIDMESSSKLWIHLLLAGFLMGLMSTTGAYDFYVGGRAGWVQSPSEGYNQWAERNRFQVNDKLVFKYKKGEDSVLVVKKEDYDSCNVNNPVQRLDGGDSVFKFDRSGLFFFISGSAGHCKIGQKVIVLVLAVRNKKPTPPTPVLPPPSLHAPSTSPSTAPQPSSPASSPSSSPSSSSPATSPSSSISPSPAPFSSISSPPATSPSLSPSSHSPLPSPFSSISAPPATSPSLSPSSNSPSPSPSSSISVPPATSPSSSPSSHSPSPSPSSSISSSSPSPSPSSIHSPSSSPSSHVTSPSPSPLSSSSPSPSSTPATATPASSPALGGSPPPATPGSSSGTGSSPAPSPPPSPPSPPSSNSSSPSSSSVLTASGVSFGVVALVLGGAFLG